MAYHLVWGCLEGMTRTERSRNLALALFPVTASGDRAIGTAEKGTTMTQQGPNRRAREA
jgi:hypothetical protein